MEIRDGLTTAMRYALLASPAEFGPEELGKARGRDGRYFWWMQTHPVGVFLKPEFEAYKIYQVVKSWGIQVYAMCPTLHKVDGDPCYPSLSALPERVDVAIVMLPAEECAAVAEEMARLGIRRAWLAVPQPAWLRTVTPMFRERGIASTFGCPLMHWNLADVSPANRLRHFCWLHGLRSRKIHHQDRGG